MDDESPSEVPKKRRSSQPEMELDGDKESLSETPPVKRPKDEFCSDDGDEEEDEVMEEVEKTAETEKTEEEKAAAAAAEEEGKRGRDELLKQWAHDEPYVNQELPFPTARERAHFCWYDLSEPWNELVMPVAAPVRYINRNFSYGDQGFVRLPFSKGQAPCKTGRSDRPRDGLILEAILSFSRGVRSITHIEAGIRSYWERFSATNLHKVFAACGGDEEKEEEILLLLEKIAHLALRSEQIVTKALPALTIRGPVQSVSMSQEQAACLLAYAFFCTFVPVGEFNHLSFLNIHAKATKVHYQKLLFILAYFRQVTDKMPTGTLTFSRQSWRYQAAENAGYESWKEPVGELHVTATGLIEEMDGCLQVDFANEYIGGGVMGGGAVQEEIRFLCCPEMLVSMLLCDKMESHEAILIQGAQQYSGYAGYAQSLEYRPMRVRDDARDVFGRARSYLIAIDAFNFPQSEMQFQQHFITREIKKAYAGFQRLPGISHRRPVATGNWGCGVFHGDKELKSLIQLIAAGRASRAVIYITFGDSDLAQRLQQIHKKLLDAGATVGELYTMLTEYKFRQRKSASVFDFVGALLYKTSQSKTKD